MIIKSMKLKDFRQFYGESEFKFGTNDQNVTLIIGANGNGKTGLFRALMFVLYGDKSLKQDENIQNINLVNTAKLEENKNYPVEATVEMHFEFNDVDYVIRRSITSIKKDNQVSDRIGDPELYTFSEAGDYVPYREGNENVFINRIIEPEIREFFFFDAERMELLDTTKSEKSLSKGVQEGIIRLLQIKYLEDSVKELNKMMREKQAEIKRQVQDEEIDNKTRKKTDTENEIKRTEEILINYRNEKRALSEEMIAIKNKLSSNAEIKEVQDKVSKEKEILQYKEENRSQYKNQIKQLLKKGIHYGAKDILNKNELFLKEYLNNSSDMIPRSLLEKTLHDLTCTVCRTRFDEDSSQYLSIDKLLKEYKFSNNTEVIRNILHTHNNLNSNEKTFISSVDNLIKKLVKNKEEIEISEIEIKQLNDLIGEKAANIKNLNQLEVQLKEYYKDEKQLNDSIISAEYKLEQLKKSLNDLGKEIDKLSEKYSRVQKDIAIKNKLQHFRDVLEETILEYSSSITEELSNEIFSTFMTLLDKKDRNNYKEVRIGDNFEINLLNHFDQNVVQDLSMGQGQIFSLSFILSLAKIASRGRTEINFPLFMDTPFARLSRDNRDNLIKNIPKLTNQWILLLTDTEFTNTEKGLFEEYKQVGKTYVLDNQNGRTTPISYEKLSQLEMGDI
ncbi:AAA family ATPase [Globicatella sanguinis]